MNRVEDERRCPRCGAPHGEPQEYCLECGARLPTTAGLVAHLGTAWRRRLGWYPGDWVWPALLALVVAAVAGVISALWLADSSKSATETVVATSPRALSVPSTATAPEPTTAPSTTAAVPTAPGPPPPAAPTPATTIAPWPVGKAGWTIVLNSIPTSNGRAGALAQARQAARLGLKQAGVLDSSNFSSLHPGYYVVFSGVYDTEPDAQSHLLEAHRKAYSAAYVRRITP